MVQPDLGANEDKVKTGGVRLGNAVVVGVDVGGTKIAVGLVDQEGKVISRRKHPTGAGDGRDAIMQRIIRYTSEMISYARELGFVPQAVGIATPGILDYESGKVRFATVNLKGWSETPIVSEVQQALALPCAVENDANAAAIAESRLERSGGIRDILFISVGTGIGGGIILGGNIVRGFIGSAGGFGHISIDHAGPRCYCGNHGCVELYASGKAIAERVKSRAELRRRMGSYEKPGTEPNDGPMDELGDVRRIIEIAVNGDIEARGILEECGRYIGMAAASAINLLNPQAVIVGGGVAEAGDLLLKPIRDVVRERTFPPAGQETKVKKATFAGDAGFLGASLLAWDMVNKGSREAQQAVGIGQA